MIRTQFCLKGCGAVGWHEQNCPGEKIEQLSAALVEITYELEEEKAEFKTYADENELQIKRLERDLDKIQKLASDVPVLQEPDPDTGDRNVSFFALMEVLEG